MLTERDYHSVAITIMDAVGIVMIYCPLSNCQIMNVARGEHDDSDGTDDTVSLEVYKEVLESGSDKESKRKLVRRQTSTSKLRRTLLCNSEDLRTSMAPIVSIVASVSKFFEISNKNLYGQFGFVSPSEYLVTALAQLVHVITSISTSLQDNKINLYEQHGSENQMTNVVCIVDNVAFFAESLQNRKKDVYEQLKALSGLSKRDCIRAMIRFVKDEDLVATVMSANVKYKEEYVLCLIGDAPCMERRSDYKIESGDLQTQSEDDPESEDENVTSAYVRSNSGEGSEVESVQRCISALNNRSRPCSDSEHPMLPLLERLAKAISSIAELFKKPCNKKLNRQLKTLLGLSKQDFIRARLLLVEDPDITESFMVLDEEHKMDLVLMLLGKA